MRRSVHELRTLYRLEPSLRDIYVEGWEDALFYGWFCRSRGLGCNVKSIDTVDVSRELVESYDLDVGQRGRVIALALELASSSELAGQVRFIADRDHYCLMGEQCPSLALLLYTDYACLEGYFLARPHFRRFMELTLGLGQDVDADVVRSRILDVLSQVFLVRAILHLERIGGHMLTRFERCCAGNPASVAVSLDELLSRCRIDVSLQSQVRAKVEMRLGTIGDRRYAVSGEDLVRFLRWLFSAECNRAGLRQSEAVRAALRSVSNVEELAGEDLFRSIAEFGA